MPGDASRENGKKGGRPKNVKSLLDKEQAREEIRKLVLKHLVPLVKAQIANAKGISFLMVREKNSGKFKRVVDKGRAERLNPEEEIIEVWAKDPQVQAFTDLMNRVVDKPKEQPAEIKLTGEVEIISRLQAARMRLAQRSLTS